MPASEFHVDVLQVLSPTRRQPVVAQQIQAQIPPRGRSRIGTATRNQQRRAGRSRNVGNS